MQDERARLGEEATRAAVLERVDEQRAALLRSVSHDLRTPLATIAAVVSDLLGGPGYDEATVPSCWGWSPTRPSGWTGWWRTCWT